MKNIDQNLVPNVAAINFNVSQVHIDLLNKASELILEDNYYICNALEDAGGKKHHKKAAQIIKLISESLCDSKTLEYWYLNRGIECGDTLSKIEGSIAKDSWWPFCHLKYTESTMRRLRGLFIKAMIDKLSEKLNDS